MNKSLLGIRENARHRGMACTIIGIDYILFGFVQPYVELAVSTLISGTHAFDLTDLLDLNNFHLYPKLKVFQSLKDPMSKLMLRVKCLQLLKLNLRDD